MPAKTPVYKSKPFLVLCMIGISALFMWLAMRDILADPEALQQLKVAFQTADYSNLPLILLVIFGFYWLKAWRWRLLLTPVGDFRPLKDLFAPTLIGFAFNNVLPFRIGEFVRCFVFSKQSKLPLPLSVSSVVLERVFDVVAILTYLGIGLLFADIPEEIKTGAYFLSIGVAAFVACGFVYVFWTQPFVNFVEAILSKVPLLPDWLNNKLCRTLEAGAEGLASLKSVRLLIAMLVISFVKWALNAYLVVLALDSFGIDVSFLIALIVMGCVAIGVGLPSAPGYFGIIQYAFKISLIILLPNFDQAKVFAASVYFHMSQYIPVTLVGLAFFVWTGISFRKVEEAEEHKDEILAEAAGSAEA